MNSERVVVLKFGGSSLSSTESIDKVVSIIRKRVEEGFKVVAVVSARGKTTEMLLEDARKYAPEGNPREFDMLLTTGERASAAIVAMALSSNGIPSISLTGSQAGIITDDKHTNARIVAVRPQRVADAINEGKVVVIGGFQGVSFKKEVTTLGRGGSDTTAVAIAASLDAEKCEIFSDVDGVYSADPAIISDAELLEEISYQEMQELSEAGAKVLHSRAVEFAKLKGIEIHCKNTFDPEKAGTVIRGFENAAPRKTGVAYERNVILVHTYESDSNELTTIGKVLDFCDKSNVSVKQVSFHQGYRKNMVGSFIFSKKENYSCDDFIGALKRKFPAEIEVFDDLSAVSVVGDGITDRQEVLLNSIDTLKKNRIKVFAFHTSSFRISMLVKSENLDKSVKLMHSCLS